MGSNALNDLLLGVSEVRALRAHVRPQRSVHSSKAHTWTAARIANRRACVVLLCSHYERYIYTINEEATDFLNSVALESDRIPERIRLLQAKGLIDDLATQSWERRSEKLQNFANMHADMWISGRPVTTLDAAANLTSMKSPKVEDVIRYFESFGLPRVLDKITRSNATRRNLARNLQSLVDSRNGIAHGDSTVQPLSSEVTDYCNAVTSFSTRVDKVFSKTLQEVSGSAMPW